VLSSACTADPGTAAPGSAGPDIPTVASGKIERLALFQSRHVPARNVDIWLPDAYPKDQPYSVLYMHDGQMLFDATQTWNHQEWRVDEVAGELIARGKVQPFIVVGIWNAGDRRHSEYFPQKPFALLAAAKQQELLALKRDGNPLFVDKLASDAYLKFVIDELKPYVDSHFAVDGKREHTAILGSSMGGLISLYALTEYPKVFGAMAAMSTHWPGAFSANDTSFPDAMLAYLEKELPQPGRHRLYFDHGTATLDAWYPPSQKRVDALLAELGIQGYWLSSKEFAGADHSEKSWAARLDQPLEFLFQPDPQPDPPKAP
jgi:enterochelin esterase-like enzyme